MNRLHKIFAVFAIGLFALAAQTLLFREFLGAFESNDIAVGLFFGSWFLWIALAAWLVVRFKSGAKRLAERTPLLMLLYLPAFVVQYLLILHIRSYSGVEAFAIFPFWKMVVFALLANAPLSVVTGAIFPLACQWLSGTEKLSVSTVYIFESLGSFAGGLAVTLLLAAGFNLFFVFLLAAMVPALAVYLLKPQRLFGIVLPLALLVGILFRVDVPLNEAANRWKWARLLPAETFHGSFQTAQAEYLYGAYQGQWTVLREGGTCETIPDTESAGKILAIHLAQNPHAERILVVGAGLGLCREFLRLPQVGEVTWAHYDNGYAEKMNRVVPDALKMRDARFHPLVEGDIRTFLARKKNYYDLVVVNLPDVTSSLANRYFTTEFYGLAKHALRDGGAMGVRLNAGENVIGPELAALGASATITLGKTFSRLVMAPGETTWFIVSDSDRLTGKPDVLVRRLAANRSAAALFPPEALRSLYLPDREIAARETYAAVRLPEDALLNVDEKPLACRFGLLLASRHAGLEVTALVGKLAENGILFLTVPLLVFLAWLALFAYVGGGRGRRLDLVLSVWLMSGTGFVGIGTVIVLMYCFQTALGSLFLHVGLLSAVFMLGLAAGGGLVTAGLGRFRAPALILTGLIAVHLAVLLLFVSPLWTVLGLRYFMGAFAVSGICCGGYFPLAAAFMRDSGHPELEAGGILESADHVGATAGACLCGVLIIPVFGSATTLLFFMAILLSVMAAALVCRHGRRETGTSGRLAMQGRAVVYFLAGVICLAIIWTVMLWGRSGTALPPAKIPILPNFAAHPETVREAIKPLPIQNGVDASAEPGEVNLETINSKIKNRQLSDREAEYYTPL